MAKKKAPATKGSSAKSGKKPGKKSATDRLSRGGAAKVSTKQGGQATKRIRSITNAPQKVDKQQAIRERLRLHPLAMPNEIAAMLEFDGMKVTAEEVEKIRAAEGAAQTPMKRSPRSSPSPSRRKR